MLLLNMVDGTEVASITNSKGRLGIAYDEETTRKIEEARRNNSPLIALHNHPNGMPPSLDDGASAFVHDYEMGVIVGHNLNIYSYSKTDKDYSTDEFNMVRELFNRSHFGDTDFSLDEWYNMLKERGMTIRRHG